MPFKLDNQCVDAQHNFSPIIEGGQTVGLKCSACPKTVREDMQQSTIVVTAKGIENGPPFIAKDFRPHPRKDRDFK